MPLHRLEQRLLAGLEGGGGVGAAAGRSAHRRGPGPVFGAAIAAGPGRQRIVAAREGADGPAHAGASIRSTPTSARRSVSGS